MKYDKDNHQSVSSEIAVAFGIISDTEDIMKHWNEYDAFCDGCAYLCNHGHERCGLYEGSIRCKKKFMKEQLDFMSRSLKEYFNDKYFC